MEVVGRDHCGSRFGDRSTHVEGLSIRVEDLSMHVLPMHVEGLPAHVEDLSTRGRSRGLAMA